MASIIGITVHYRPRTPQPPPDDFPTATHFEERGFYTVLSDDDGDLVAAIETASVLKLVAKPRPR